MDLAGAAEGGGGDLREAEVGDLALVLELDHGADGVFDRGLAVDAVAVVQVDGGDAEAGEGFGARGFHVGWVAADGVLAVLVGGVGEFGGEEDVGALAGACEPFADELFVVAVPST